MHRLLPDPSPASDPVEVYRTARTAPPGRPWVVANMIASADGTATVDGRSGGLGGSADRLVFTLLRSVADVIVVGASTVRAEHYKPVLEPRPTPIAVVTRSLDLDWASPLYVEAIAPTIVLTCEAADPEQRRRAEAVADVVVAGGESVEPALALAALAERGHDVALCEGGPTLLGAVIAAGLLDELCLTIAPTLVVGDGPRIALGGAGTPAPLTLASVLEDEGFLLLRYLAAR